MLGFEAIFPKIHVAKVYYGQTVSAMQVDRWWYRGRHLYGAYDTDQKFLDDMNESGNRSILPAFYTNNLKLIERHKTAINQLASQSLSAPPPAGRSMKVISTVCFLLFISAIATRTYAKFAEFNGSDNVEEVLVLKQPETIKSVEPALMPVVSIVDPLNGYQIRLLGTTLYKNGYHAHFELVKDERKALVNESDLVVQGYQWRMLSSCSVVLTFGGRETPLFCTTNDEQNKV